MNYNDQEESYANTDNYGEFSVSPRIFHSISESKENNVKSADSLFDYPGILELNPSNIVIPLYEDAYDYDLSSFHAQIVKNSQPFAFDINAINMYQHAQHKLRVITYYYAKDYVSEYLMKGNGLFIEKHEFIQSITPVSTECAGYVILGRETQNARSIELIAVTIPFGYTLLIEPMSLHGDSSLTGMYVMAMTGNHHAMATADTVYIKNTETTTNVDISVCTISENHSTSEIVLNEYSHFTDNSLNLKIPVEINSENGVVDIVNHLLLTSDVMPLSDLHIHDTKLKEDISKNVADTLPNSWMAPENYVKKILWQPVIYTPTHSTFGWEKTLGTHLPTP
jgi:hypothetical protein